MPIRILKDNSPDSHQIRRVPQGENHSVLRPRTEIVVERGPAFYNRNVARCEQVNPLVRTRSPERVVVHYESRGGSGGNPLMYRK